MCIEYRPIILRNILFIRELLFYDIFHNCFNCILCTVLFYVHYIIIMNFLSEINIIYITSFLFCTVLIRSLG